MAENMTLEDKVGIIQKALEEKGVEAEGLADFIAEQLDGEIKRTNMFNCPNCDSRLQFSMNLRIRMVEDTTTGARWSATEERKQELLDRAMVGVTGSPLLRTLKESGLFDAFVDMNDKLDGAAKTSNPEKAICNLINKAHPYKLHPFIKTKLIRAYQAIKVEAYSNGHFAVVIADGIVKGFIPTQLLKGETLSGLTLNGMEITKTKDPISTDIWIRSKFGYVLGRGAMLDELRKKSKGAFANTGL